MLSGAAMANVLLEVFRPWAITRQMGRTPETFLGLQHLLPTAQKGGLTE